MRCFQTKLTPELAPPSPNFPTIITGGRSSLNISNVHQPPLHGGFSEVPGSNSRHTGQESVTLTIRLPRPPVELKVLPWEWCGNLERGVPAQVSSTSFDRSSFSKSARVALSCDVNITHAHSKCAFKFFVYQHMQRGHGSRGVQVTDRGLPCHEFEPSTTKDPPCKAAMHVKSVES
ncbi:hypothetical protein TNCV_3289621 [Trichonephila clavipes]|nr:hypothetical protein TNCV_3289621 [Trichonephila clavipes]